MEAAVLELTVVGVTDREREGARERGHTSGRARRAELESGQARWRDNERVVEAQRAMSAMRCERKRGSVKSEMACSAQLVWAGSDSE